MTVICEAGCGTTGMNAGDATGGNGSETDDLEMQTPLQGIVGCCFHNKIDSTHPLRAHASMPRCVFTTPEEDGSNTTSLVGQQHFTARYCCRKGKSACPKCR